MKNRRIVFLLCGVLIVTAAIYLFSPESGSIVWHLRHGSRAHLDSLEFQVPAFYWSESYPGKSVIYINSVPGRARNYFKDGKVLRVSFISLHRREGSQSPPTFEDKENPRRPMNTRGSLIVG